MEQTDDLELKALMTLLDDPDPEVFEMIRKKILSLGPDALQSLEEEWERHFDNEVQGRIESLMHDIQFDDTLVRFKAWLYQGALDVMDGALIIAKYQYPDLDIDQVKEKMDRIIDDVRTEMNLNLGPLEKVKIINHILYDIHGFRGNKQNYHAPQNSYINDVVHTKRGNPLTLGLIYLRIAAEFNIPIFGINLPEHFILGYLEEKRFSELGMRAPVLFYINAFNRGAIFRKAEVELFIKQMNLEPLEQYFSPCTNEEIALRILYNLTFAYERLGYLEKIQELNKFKEVIANR